MDDELRQCPFCGEMIKAGAIKCKHCKEFLPEERPVITGNRKCPYCGEEILAMATKCKHCGEWLNNSANSYPASSDSTIRKIADYQKTANILWLIIAILQICSIICIIAGIWNIIAVSTGWKLPDKILRRDEDVPSYYESIVGLVVIAVVNFLLGGLIGVALVAFEFYIRSLVLENKHLFVKNAEVQ